VLAADRVGRARATAVARTVVRIADAAGRADDAVARVLADADRPGPVVDARLARAADRAVLGAAVAESIVRVAVEARTAVAAGAGVRDARLVDAELAEGAELPAALAEAVGVVARLARTADHRVAEARGDAFVVLAPLPGAADVAAAVARAVDR